MNKETALSLLRAVLTLAGSYLVGHNLFGVTVDQNWLLIIIGAVMTLGSTLWGIFDKTIGSDQLASALRSAVTSIVTIFVSAGKLSSNNAEQIIAIIVAIIPVILSQAQKSTVKQIANGTAVAQIVTKPTGQGAETTQVITGKVVKQGGS